ncbi:MAG: thymidine kinase [Bernardetiaceae bacterium]|nr:thymidine kinase [Bernardetiaceae bacterium]
MFLEPDLNHTVNANAQVGWIEVVCGSMFSGKTEELIRRVRRALIAKQEVSIFKPLIDTRYDKEKVVSHNKNAVRSIPVNSAKDILIHSHKAQVVAIDEAQFFDKDLPDVCQILANQGKRVIVAGLDMDFEGKPFGWTPHLLAIAEFITKVHAICVKCGSIASYSYRLTASKERVLLGEKEAYEPRCRQCFYKDKKKEAQVYTNGHTTKHS